MPEGKKIPNPSEAHRETEQVWEIQASSDGTVLIQKSKVISQVLVIYLSHFIMTPVH